MLVALNGFAGSPFFTIASAIQIVVDIMVVLAVVVMIVGNLAKPLWRFGKARWKKPILIYGNSEQYGSLKKDFVATGIVRERNVSRADADHMGEIAEAWTIVICADGIEDDDVIRILEAKPPRCAALVYAPPNRRLGPAAYKECNMREHVAVCNMRGRLTDELILTLFTTSFKK